MRSKERETIGSKSASRLRTATNLVQTASASSLDLRPSTSHSTLRRSASVSSLRTPVKSTPTKNIQPSNEHARRAATAENSQKVLKVLQQDDVFYRKLVLNNGLKSMTASKFLDIIGYLIQLISGKNMITGRQSDYETDILNFIKSLGYPYLVNKSWFRTPNAPHAYHECVALLAWLCDFITFPEEQRDDENPTKEIINDSNLPNAEFTKLFSLEVRNGFYLWNNNKDEEFGVMKTMLANEFISQCMKGRLNTVEEVLERIEEMKKYCDEAKKIEYFVKNEKKFAAVEEQYIQCENKIQELETSCTLKTDELASIEIAYGVKQEKIDMKQKNIENLLNVVRTQKRNVNELNDLKMKLTTIKNSVDSIKEEILSLKKEDASNQVKLARLIQQKTDVIGKLNKIFHKISQTLVKCKENIPLIQLHVNPNASLFQIQEIKTKVTDLMYCIQEIKKQRDLDLNNVNETVRALILQEKQLIEKDQKNFDILNKQTTMIRKIDAEIADKNSKITCGSVKLTDSLSELHLLKNKKLEDIENKKRRCIEYEKENQEIFEAGERRAKELFVEKQEIIENLDKAIDCVDSLEQEMENSA